MKVRLHFYLRNHGDGSASAVFCATRKLADDLDNAQDEGWGESSADFIDLEAEGPVRASVVVSVDEDGDTEEEVVELKPA